LNGKKILHNLASLETFKLLYCLDDREDELSRWILETATAQIEGRLVAGNFILQENIIVAPCEGICFWSVNLRCFAACMRRLCYKKVTQGFDGTGGYYFELLDYPVRSVISVRAGATLPLGADCAVSPADYFVSPNKYSTLLSNELYL
jgi:hypothetical protein